MFSKIEININSEIGELEGVILHTPGLEVENMTPENAERALYSDILNLSVASQEYAQFSGVLNKVAKTFQVKELLTNILQTDKVKRTIVKKVCYNESIPELHDFLILKDPTDLASALIEGVTLRKNTLTRYLSKERFILKPLHNFFFTRDASVAVNDFVLVSKMANKVRERESLIMEAIFDYHPFFNTTTINPAKEDDLNPNISMEGGDILIARKDVLLIGISSRTTSEGIDYILKKAKTKNIKHIIAQELPYSPESFIHLDMVFTFLDKNTCMIYEPLIMKSNRYLTLNISIDNGKVIRISEEENIIAALKNLNFDLNPLLCGGSDVYNQEREQWHSGANFFAFAPGKIIGYERNVHTIDVLSKNGFEVLSAKDIISEKVSMNNYSKFVITIHGSELSRGGGGCRCMTMPVRRKEIIW
jgi:arginine deiminase